MPMPGEETMSMMWMPMPGQTWLDVAASFLAMWVVMMAAMMLPSLLPVLMRYRRMVVMAGVMHPNRLTALVGAGYLFAWAAIGMALFPLGAGVAAIGLPLPTRAVPMVIGVVVLIAGALQFGAWKAHHLAKWREIPGELRTGGALRYGVRLGLHCGRSCANLMAILLVIGMMDLRAMAVVTAAITIERLAPSGERAARAVGVVTVGAGLLLIARAALIG